MEYRVIPHSGDKVSTIGIGAGSLREAAAGQVEAILRTAMERGVNLMDTIMTDEKALPGMVSALKGNRDKMRLQMHFSAVYPNGIYARTRDLEQVKAGFQRELKKYGTDYADIGLIHCVDEDSDFQAVFDNGIFDYMLDLKKQGVVRNVGFASHSPQICKRFLETGAIDIFMLSVNAAYDFAPGDDGKLAIDRQRQELYQDCERRGVAITVMKPYGGGQLLAAGTSPFGKEMTAPQCIQYALDRPGVVSCLTGVKSVREMEDALAYYEADQQARSYAFLGGLPRKDIQGACLYCNHCQPCPKGIDIGMVNKYVDLARAGDELAAEHYRKLEHHASDCIGCGACEKRCPFGVSIRKRMQQTKELFGE